MGYTYKNFELVNDHDVPGMGTVLSTDSFFVQVVSLGDKPPKVGGVESFNLVEKEAYI